MSFYLASTVNFPSRIQNGFKTATDKVFVDSTRKDCYSIKPVINGLFDHDAELIVINNIEPVFSNYNCRKQTDWTNKRSDYK
jgi:hypothetical protein